MRCSSMNKGKIIWLNGVSSSGKSTLVNELQKRLPNPYFCIAQDTFTDIIAPWFTGFFNGINADDLWYTAIEAMYHTIKLYSDLGNNVIVDHVVLDQDDGKEQRYFNECMKILRGYPLMLVKVTCPLEELKLREIKRGDRDIGNSEGQVKQGLYPLDGYDIAVDTYANTTAECADMIISLSEEHQ